MSCIHQNAEVILEAFIARIRTAKTFKEIKNVQIYQNTLNAQGDITKYRKVLEEIFKETYPALKNVEDIFIVEENTSSLSLNISPEFSKVYEDIFINKLLKEKAEYDKKGYKNGNFTIFKNIDTVPFLLATDEFRALEGQSFQDSSGRVTKQFVRDYSNSSAALEKLKRKFGRSNVEYSKTFKDGMYVNKVQVYSPVLENYTSNKQLSLFLSPEVDYSLKAVNILSSDKAKQIFAKGEKAKWDLNKILTELSIPKNQKQLLLDLGITDREQLALELASKYGYSVEVNPAKEKLQSPSDIYNFNFNGNNYSMSYYQGIEDDYTTYFKNDKEISYEEYNKAQNEYLKIFQETVPTQHYSNLTVPGGTNYTENEISTPLIIPSIKGHAAFSTDNGIGWFRSDEQTEKNTQEKEEYIEYDTEDGETLIPIKKQEYKGGVPTKIRRVLELQSDLFQKGRDRSDLVNKSVRGLIATEPEGRTLIGAENSIIYRVVKRGNKYYAEAIYEYPDAPEDLAYSTNNGDSFNSFKAFDNKEEADIYLNELRSKIESLQNKSKNTPENQFLQLLNKDSNWVTFFVKSIIQDSAKKGYEKVLFPKGETAAKIEGHETIADEIRKINEDIQILELFTNKSTQGEALKRSYVEGVKGYYIKWVNTDIGYDLNHGDKNVFLSIVQQAIVDLNKKKQDLKSQGIEKLKPIEAFYEIKVGNILEKQFGKDNVKTITDEYGNEWREITIVAERDLANIHLSPEVKEGVSELFESNQELANSVYSKLLTNTGISAENLLSLLEKENIVEKDCTGGGKLKAKDGIATLFEKGGKWEIVTDFKNAPTHKSGGKDVSIQGKKVEVEKNELRIENDFGDVAVIPSKYRAEVQDAVKSNCHSCIDGIVESLPKMKDYAGDGTVFPFFGRYKRFKNSLPDNLKNTPEDDYAMRYYWKHNNKPKSFDEAINKERPMFTMGDDGYYHAPSVEPNTLRFLKPKNHPTLQYELDWYNSDNPDAVDFRSRYDLDMSGKFYKYVPKKQ